MLLSECWNESQMPQAYAIEGPQVVGSDFIERTGRGSGIECWHIIEGDGGRIDPDPCNIAAAASNDPARNALHHDDQIVVARFRGRLLTIIDGAKDYDLDSGKARPHPDIACRNVGLKRFLDARLLLPGGLGKFPEFPSFR
jgi:hypothetical protein